MAKEMEVEPGQIKLNMSQYVTMKRQGTRLVRLPLFNSSGIRGSDPPKAKQIEIRDYGLDRLPSSPSCLLLWLLGVNVRVGDGRARTTHVKASYPHARMTLPRTSAINNDGA